MSFLTPLFFLALGAMAVPVLIHLTQKERKSVVEFPSLMFLRKIPYESVQRRRLRDILLLMLRLAALVLIVAAFARPFLRGSELSAAAGGARDIVVLVDRSYSMGYGDTWTRAQRAVEQALAGATPADRISVVAFADVAEVLVRSTPDRSRAIAAVTSAQPGPGSTRFGPALKLASSLIAESLLPRKEIIVVSDFQRAGWLPDDTLRVPGGTQITPVVVEGASGLNLAVTPVALLRARDGGQERITVTANVLNRSGEAATNVPIHLEVDGRAVQDLQISAAPHSSASVSFAPLTITSANTRASVRIGNPGQAVDALERDNVFHFVATPAAPVPVLLVSQGRAEQNLYLSRALAIGEQPRFDTSLQAPDALAGDAMNRARLIILNDVPISEAAAARLVAFVEGGGGLLIAAGPRASWPGSRADWLPASIGQVVDRTRGAPARLSGMDYGHAVFEPFRAPRSGDFSTSRFYSYRALGGAKGATVLARFDTGEPALIERTAGRGRIVLFASTLDLAWNDLALKPMFLPFVHQLGRHLSGFKEQPAWLTIGQVLDVDAAEIAAGATSGATARAAAGRTVLAPGGQRRDLAAGSSALELGEQGFYEIRGSGRDAGPVIVAASNVSIAESDLTRMDPKELVAAVTGGDPTGSTSGADVLPDEAQELAQRVWWYLLFAGILLLIAETVLAHRLTRATR
jgi:hypothetical protein